MNPNISLEIVCRTIGGIRATRVLASFAMLLAFSLGSQGLGAQTNDPIKVGLEHRFHDDIQPFLETYCYNCHTREKPKGDFDMRPFKDFESIGNEPARWRQILDQLEEKQMPPEEAKRQPGSEERQKAVFWIREARTFEAHRHAGDPGVVLARRLSNAEYDNSIRDLTGVDIHPAREFPVDPANEAGFDNSGESLAMSPSLVKKYLEASRNVAEHLIFKPQGLAFAPFSVIADTDRDKYGVRQILDFYRRQPTNYAPYFAAAWRYRHRVALGETNATLPRIATASHLSLRYLETIWATLSAPAENLGPIAAVRILFNTLPTPGLGQTDQVDQRCDQLADFICRLRAKVQVHVENLRVEHMSAGSQPLVLWKDRQMAASRRSYGGGALQWTPDEIAKIIPSPLALAPLSVPTDDSARQKYEESFRRFCEIFPDAFYISERGRVFLEHGEDKQNTGRYLSAGFHNQMGYFRDDQPLYELILSEDERTELDSLWAQFEFSSELPLRMHSGFVWYERAESSFIQEPQFEFARPEDKDLVAPEKFRHLHDVYLEKVRRSTTNEAAIEAVEDHFRRTEQNVRWLEKARMEAEPTHLAALEEFAGRAYRRPLTAQDREDITSFYESLRKSEGAGHEEAIRDTLVSILLSPHFCFRLDLPVARPSSPPGQTQPLSDQALASRLSYFLWASLPDAELRRHAEAGDLHQPSVLVAQTRRLLKDPKIRGLAVEFGGNWLDFRRFEEHNAVDRARFPTFDNELRSAMFEEPVRFFLDVVQEDRSVFDFLLSHRTFVNATLARHYGIPFVAQDTNSWLVVDDANPYGRGGLLPMAVFQTRNAPGLRTSPVKRGYWVARRLLGEQIPPPPAKVPELPADEAKLGELTLRDALAKHREDKLCAGCHARFDSFGLAFEGYGPIGERRTIDLAGHPVDTHAVFPGGGEGSGVVGLREYLRSQRRGDFLENLSRKLLAYALGRSLQLSDDPTIDSMREAALASGYRFSSLVETIVTSPQFLYKRSNGELSRQ
jgi:hypothetical protein